VGGIIPFRWAGSSRFRWAASSRYGGRHHSVLVGGIVRNQHYEHKEKAGDIDLYAASLVDNCGFEPENHGFWSERVDWVGLKDKLKKNG
jgi:hypothetical protein